MFFIVWYLELTYGSSSDDLHEQVRNSVFTNSSHQALHVWIPSKGFGRRRTLKSAAMGPFFDSLLEEVCREPSPEIKAANGSMGAASKHGIGLIFKYLAPHDKRLERLSMSHV